MIRAIFLNMALIKFLKKRVINTTTNFLYEKNIFTDFFIYCFVE